VPCLAGKPFLCSGMRWLVVTACVFFFAVLVGAQNAAKPVLLESELPVGETDWSTVGWKVGTSHANVLRLGTKFQLSGIGDSVKNDEWLRLFDIGNKGFYGGLAAGKLWGKSLLASSLEFDKTWKLAASADVNEKDWLKLTSAGGKDYHGGLAAGKLKTKSITVDGDTQTERIRVAKQFLLKPEAKGSTYLRLVDPVTDAVHKKGGLVLGTLRSTDATIEKYVSTPLLKLGKWHFYGSGDPIKNDEYLRLMSSDGKTLYGGLEAAKLKTQTLNVHQHATFQGKATFNAAVFKGKVTFEQVLFGTMGGTSVQVGKVILSNIGAKHDQNDWLHVYRADGKTYGAVAMAEARTTRTSTSVLQLGKKWRLSGMGDKFHNDDWLRLMNTENTGYYGGLAMKKLWTPKAYTHVVQIGTKWRLSGVGDVFKDDEWLRLMDIGNTKLYGGFEAQKLKAQTVDVKGMAAVDHLKVKEKFKLIAGNDALKVMNVKGNQMEALEASKLTIAASKDAAITMKVAGIADFATIKATATITSPQVVASTALKVGIWKFEATAEPVGQNSGLPWLRLYSTSDKKDGQLQLAAVKAKELTASDKVTGKNVHATNLHATKAIVKGADVQGKLTVKDGIWVGNNRLTPLPGGLLEDVQALKEELAMVKEQLAELTR